MSAAPIERYDRASAMLALFLLDAQPEIDDRSLLHALAVRSDTDEGAASGEPASPGRAEAVARAREVFTQRAQIDADVLRVAPDWPAHRQAAVDRALIRLGCHELALAKAPAELTINAMIELAKRYSTDRSGSFVNAVLDRVAHDLGRLGSGSTQGRGQARAGLPATEQAPPG